MSGNPGSVPDAWDDDWEVQADKPEEEAEAQQRISKAERLAKHAEQNKTLWDSADSTENFHLLSTRNDVPLKADFKPAVKVLSRRPLAPTPTATKDPVTGVATSGIACSDDEDDEHAKQTLSPEEMMQKAQQDREEKKRRYEEARERLFGPSNPTKPGRPSSSASTGSVGGGPSNDDADGRRPRGRGGNRAIGGGREPKSGESGGFSAPSQKPRPAQQQLASEQLYDPSYTVKPATVGIQRRSTAASPEQVSREAQQPIRTPRGPDSTGRGGFGFADRARGSS